MHNRPVAITICKYPHTILLSHTVMQLGHCSCRSCIITRASAPERDAIGLSKASHDLRLPSLTFLFSVRLNVQDHTECKVQQCCPIPQALCRIPKGHWWRCHWADARGPDSHKAGSGEPTCWGEFSCDLLAFHLQHAQYTKWLCIKCYRQHHCSQPPA